MHVVHYSSAYQRNAMIMIMNQNSDTTLENDCTELHTVVTCFYQQPSNHLLEYF